MQRLWDQMHPWQRAAGTLIGSLAALLLLTRFVLVPLWGERLQNDAERYDFEVKLGDAKAVVARLPEQERRLEEARRSFESLRGRFGGGRSLARALDHLAQCGRGAGVQISIVQEAPTRLEAASGLDLQQVPLHVSLTGSYAAIGGFFRLLSEAPLICELKEMRLQPLAAGDSRLQADVALRVLLLADAAP